jgi:hypothetical protein
MSRNDVTVKGFAERHTEIRKLRNLLDRLDPFVSAPNHMVCDECDEFIPLDVHGFNYDHHCLDLSEVRNDYATLMVRLPATLERYLSMAGSAPIVFPKLRMLDWLQGD